MRHIAKNQGHLSTAYVRANGKTIARVKNGVTTFIHSDHLGSAQVGTDGSGLMTFQEYYTPFGEVINASAENDNQAGFTGHIRDTATGLTYMQARYYDPNIGRFLSIDPVTFMETGEPSQFNRYSYCYNDTVNCIDPNGEQGFGIKIEGNIPIGGSLGVEVGVTLSANNEGGRLPGGFDLGLKGSAGLTVGVQNLSGEIAGEINDGSIADSTAPNVEVNMVGNVIPTPIGLVGPAIDIGTNGTSDTNNGMLDHAADVLGAESVDVTNVSAGITAGTPGITVNIANINAAVSTSGVHVAGETVRKFEEKK